MNLTLSLSKKLTENFNSIGRRVTISAEVDHFVLAEPAALQGRVDRLIAECESAIGRKRAAMAGGAAPTRLVSAAETITKAATAFVPMAAGQPQFGHAYGGDHVDVSDVAPPTVEIGRRERSRRVKTASRPRQDG